MFHFVFDFDPPPSKGQNPLYLLDYRNAENGGEH